MDQKFHAFDAGFEPIVLNEAKFDYNFHIFSKVKMLEYQIFLVQNPMNIGDTDYLGYKSKSSNRCPKNKCDSYF